MKAIKTQKSEHRSDLGIAGLIQSRRGPVLPGMQLEQERALIQRELVKRWLPFSLAQRVHLANQMFPEGPRISLYALRELYRRYAIRSLTLQTVHTKSVQKVSDIEKQRLQRLPYLLRLLDERKNVFFVDEAVFTSRS